MIKILIVDDHKILRHGLSEILTKQEDMEIVGHAEDGFQAVDKTRELAPEVVIMDIALPGLNGIEATRQIKKMDENVKVIALSMHSNKKFIYEMLKAGASGYLLKDCEYDELVEAIGIVMTGKTYLSPSVSGLLIDNYVLTDHHHTSKQSAFSALSDREREVLQLLAEGRTTKQVGMVLHISPKTVEGHRARVMKKLEIDNIANLTKYAIQEGLTSPEPS